MTLRTRAILLITITVVGGTLLFAWMSTSFVRDTYEELVGPAVSTRQNDLLAGFEARLDTMEDRGRSLAQNQAAEFLQAAEDGTVHSAANFLTRIGEQSTAHFGLDAAIVIGRRGDVVLETVPTGYAPPGADGNGLITRDFIGQFASVFPGEDWDRRGILVYEEFVGLLTMTPVLSPESATPIGYIALYDAIDADLSLPNLRDGLGGVTVRPIKALGTSMTAIDDFPFDVELDASSHMIQFRSDPMGLQMLEIEVEPPRSLTVLEERTIRQLLLRVVVFGALIGIVLLVWFERRLLSRMQTLSGLVSAATTSAEDRPSVTLPGSDELSHLADDIEETLESLEETRDDLAAANDRLLAADEAKNTFISVVSHELRTPLTAILGFTHTLRRHWRSIDPDRVEDFLRRMTRQAVALDRMVEDLLVLSRMQSGSVRVETSVLDLRETLTSLLNAQPADRPARLVGVADVQVLADPDHLRRIVTNYVDNAFKYGRPPVSILAAVEGDMVVVRVLDDGDGVPDAFVPELFERFTQASSGDTRTSSGVGLGLSIVQQLAEHNGGRAWYERFDGQPCFAASLPLAPACSPPRAVQEAEEETRTEATSHA